MDPNTRKLSKSSLSLSSKYWSSCRSPYITITFIITLIRFVHCNDYEIAEEEPISLNSIEKANAGFVCNSEGYFADVAFGCQFYHICENSNNPYDKPSFVKHTFSCVNGTVFNQMSFTCTRYDDSIPCEASPNYFYLNKRNGDPKAYFLTEEDIFKPAQSSRHSLTSDSSSSSSPPSLYSNGPSNFAPHSNAARSSTSRKENNVINNNYDKLHTRDAADDTSANIMNSDRRQRLISSVINSYDPVDDNLNMGADIYDVNAKSVSHQTRPPYEMAPKFPSHYSSAAAQSPILKFPNNNGAKYEPATKVSTYVPLNSHYEDKIKSDYQNNGDEKMIYGTMRDNFLNKNFKSQDMEISARAVSHIQPLKNSYSAAYSDNEVTTSPPIDLPTPPPTRKTTFTPAAFSRLYIENQKAAKLEQRIPSTIEAPYAHMKNTPSLKAYDHLKQELISIQNNTSPYHEPFGSRSQDQQISKYDQYNADRYQPINPTSHYVPVPSPIRIIKPNEGAPSPFLANNNVNQKSHVFDNNPINVRQQNIQEQPLKISFINADQNSPSHGRQINDENGFVDYGTSDYKVVKQIKGKNLLIDPSLENDPARDNIIAQVLEMLSKYNRR